MIDSAESTPEDGRMSGSPEPSDVTGGYTPVRINTTGKPLDDGPRVPLFYVDGPDGEREYTMPERIPARLSVKALKIHATEGPEAARWFLVENALSAEAIHELTEGEASKHVDREQVRAIFLQIGERYYGQAQEDTAGK
jgi:hypothetical protein